jgi:hypothetical protein
MVLMPLIYYFLEIALNVVIPWGNQHKCRKSMEGWEFLLSINENSNNGVIGSSSAQASYAKI